MATFVFVHGGWAAGWQWREVATLPEVAGHLAFDAHWAWRTCAPGDIDLDLHLLGLT